MHALRRGCLTREPAKAAKCCGVPSFLSFPSLSRWACITTLAVGKEFSIVRTIAQPIPTQAPKLPV